MPHKGNTQIKVFELQADKVLVVFNFLPILETILLHTILHCILMFSV